MLLGMRDTGHRFDNGCCTLLKFGGKSMLQTSNPRQTDVLFESINLNCACCVWGDDDISYVPYDADREAFSESLLLVYWSMTQRRLPATKTRNNSYRKLNSQSLSQIWEGIPTGAVLALLFSY